MNIETLNERNRQIVQTDDYKVALAIEQLTYAIFEIMQEQGVSKAQLAERLGKSRAWVGKILSGEQNMTIRTLVTLLNELGHDVDFEVHVQSEEPGKGAGQRKSPIRVSRPSVAQSRRSRSPV
jgi:transcriptional regulator with XRE-family HTH domain